mmetsp:Transcript_43928/g.101513  ORF Transcript_43928/g.101513 Transcript_43928/m.101513 type:complete len:255 (-) Transcript_43928:228-992(-)
MRSALETSSNSPTACSDMVRWCAFITCCAFRWALMARPLDTPCCERYRRSALSCCVCWLPMRKSCVMCEVRILRKTVPDQKAMTKTKAAYSCSAKLTGTTSSMPPVNWVRAQRIEMMYLACNSTLAQSKLSIQFFSGAPSLPTAHQMQAIRCAIPTIPIMSFTMSPKTMRRSDGNRSISKWMISPARAKRSSRTMRMMRRAREDLPKRVTPIPVWTSSSNQSVPTTTMSSIHHDFVYLRAIFQGRISMEPSWHT